MNEPSTPAARWREVGTYAVAVALCLLIVVWALHLHQAYFRVPFTYGGDTMFYHLVTKGLVDHGWFLSNPSLAAPHGLDLRDVPTSDNNFYLVLLKLVTLVAGQYALALNFFFLLSFPLTIVCTLYVLRQFNISRFVAVLISLLYTFLPYHFTRGEHHLFLSAYYPLPLLVMVALWISRGDLTLDEWRTKWRAPKMIISLLVCVLLSAVGYYYAFFACFLLLVAGVIAALQRRSWRGLLLPGLLIGIIAAGTVINLLPSIGHFSERGGVQVVRRLAGEADVYGLRVAQLLLPIRWHRLEWLAKLKNDYNTRLLINENDDAALGLVGALSFLGLLWWLFFCKPALRDPQREERRRLLDHLSIFNGALLLLGTMGGFGSLIAFFGLPQVRAYNRVSIFIGFFALLALAIWLEKLAPRFAQTRARRTAFHGALVLITLIALLDQIAPNFIPDYRYITDDFSSDKVFVQKIEAQLPTGAMIFQLPLLTFPEGLKQHRMNDYDPVRGYLHSQHLRWSYGVIKGRESEVWQRMIVAKPMREMVETLAWAGFSGIYLDRFGYPDKGAQMESELARALGTVPLVSPNERLSFFDVRPLRKHLEAQYPEAEQAARREAAQNPLLVVWQGECSDREGTPTDYWRWCGSDGGLALVNRTGRAQKVRVEMTLAADYGGRLEMKGPFFSESRTIDRQGYQFTKEFLLPPGAHHTELSCDARRVLAPNDFREMVFRVRNFKLTPVAANNEVQAPVGEPQLTPASTPQPSPTSAAQPSPTVVAGTR